MQYFHRQNAQIASLTSRVVFDMTIFQNKTFFIKIPIL